MILVQLILVAAFFLLFFVAIRSRTAHSVSASKKLFFLFFVMVVIAAVLSPAAVTWVANLVGVGRGTDLVLYILAVTFGFYVVNDYLRGQDNRDQLHRLARQIAVLEAVERYHLDQAPEADEDAGDA
jgi:hypothetical protein